MFSFVKRISSLQIYYFYTAVFIVTLSFQFFIFWQVSTLDSQRKEPSTEYYFPVVPSDSSDYARMADNLINHRIFSTDINEPREPNIHWAIGYPLFLAVTKYISGSFLFASLIQMLLTSLVSVGIFVVANRFLSRGWAVLPALLYGLDPSVAYYSASIHSDAFFTSLCFLLLIVIFFYTKARTSKWSLIWFLSFGMMLGAITLIRPISQFLLIGIPILYIFLWWNKQTLSFYIRHTVIFFVGFSIVITPWLIRNYEVTGEFMLADVGSKNLLFYNTRYFLIEKNLRAEDASLGAGGYTDTDIAREVELQLANDVKNRIEKYGGQEFTHYAPVALSYILFDPLNYTKFHLINTVPYFFAGSIRHYVVSTLGPFKERAGLPAPTHTNIANQFSTLLAQGSLSTIWNALGSLSTVLLEIIYRGILLVLAIIGVFSRDKLRFKVALIFAALVGYFAILAGPVSFTRYRIVSDPYLLILATFGAAVLFGFVTMILQRYKNKSRFSKGKDDESLKISVQ